jgi:hypothetical protein
VSPFELKLLFVVVICTYRITDVKPANGGVYRCMARTNTGSYEEDYVLAIQGKINELLHYVNRSCVPLYFMYHSFSATLRLGILCEVLILPLKIILKYYNTFT